MLCNKQDISVDFESIQKIADYTDKDKAYLREAVEIINAREVMQWSSTCAYTV